MIFTYHVIITCILVFLLDEKLGWVRVKSWITWIWWSGNSTCLVIVTSYWERIKCIIPNDFNSLHYCAPTDRMRYRYTLRVAFFLLLICSVWFLVVLCVMILMDFQLARVRFLYWHNHHQLDYHLKELGLGFVLIW